MRRFILSLVVTGFCLVPKSDATVGLLQLSAPSTFRGPGDVVSGATAWYSVARGYSVSDASPAFNACLPAGTPCADVLLTNRVVTSLPSVLSTCNNTSVKCVVAAVYNKAGPGNTMLQTTNSLRPTLVVPGAGNSCPLNALFCMSFNAANSQVLEDATFNGGNLPQPITFSTYGGFSVTTNQTADLAFISSFNAGGPTVFGGTTTANQVDLYAGTDNVVKNLWGVFHAYQAVLNGASSTVTSDGVTSSAAASGAQPLYTQAYLGGDSFGDYLTGSISEVGIWPSALNSTQIANLNLNQQAFYNPLAAENSGASLPWSSNTWGANAFYNSATTTTWWFWEGVTNVSGTFKRTPMVATYNKLTATWAGPYVVGTLNSQPSTDPHGLPTPTSLDANGYSYVVYGGHNTANQTRITSGNSPSAWTDQGTIAANSTFPNPYIFSGKLDIIYTTTGTSGGTEEAIGWTQCTTSSGTVSGCAAQTNMMDAAGSSSNWLAPDFTFQVGSTVHMIIEYSAGGIGGAATNMFYAIWTPATNTICNIAGSTCVASTSWPINLASLEANFQITTGTNLGAGQALVDGSGTIHLVYTTIVGGNTVLLYQNNSGSGWSSAVTLYTYPANVNSAAGMATLRFNSSGNLECYFSDGAAGVGQTAGSTPMAGNILRATRVAGNWSSPATVLAQQSGLYGLDAPRAVVNGDPSAAITISEESANGTTFNGGLRGYLYGENGFIANPAGL
jgi:hypothetical protein